MAEFLRIAWVSPIYWSRGSLENLYRGMRDIGINAFLTQYHIEDWKTGEYKKYDLAFKVAAEYGIKVFWYTGIHRLQYTNPDTGQKFLERYKNFSACGGWEWGDEPNYMGWEHAGCKGAHDLMDSQDPTHPNFAVWGYDLSVNYNYTYTPGCELFDVGCECIYPTALAGSDWQSFLRYWIEHGMHRPNNDGFADCGKGMIPCIQAHVETSGPGAGMRPDMVGQFNIWKEYYSYPGQMKAIGFYRYGTFMGSGADKAAIREGIKEIARLTGWEDGPPPPPQYPCPYCTATFTSQADLDAHIASEHPTPPPYEDVTCSRCGSLLRVYKDGLI